MARHTKQKIWVSRWRITQKGDEQDGMIGAYLSEYAAQIACLLSINENWVDGNWGDYPAAKVRKFKRSIEDEKYKEALDLWKEMPVSYEVEVEELTIEGDSELLDIDDMDFPEDDANAEEPDDEDKDEDDSTEDD